MNGRSWIAALALLAGSLCGWVRAQAPETFESARAAQGKTVATALQGFSDWCAANKLYAERDKALEALLRFEPANDAAHRALKHSRKSDGSWVPPQKKPDARNYNASALAQCAQRRAALAKDFREGGLALLERFGTAAPADARRAFLDDLLAIDAEDAASRALLGEVRLDDAWVLTETVAAKQRRAALKELIRSTVGAVPRPTPVEPLEHERALGITWTNCVATPKLRVLSTGSEAEAFRIAIQCSAATAVFRELTGATQEVASTCTIYVLTTPVARDAFIAKWPGWDDKQRAQMKNWAGTGVPGDVHQARWDSDEARRLDGAVRHMLGVTTLLNFGFDHQQCAWVWEGLGIYLTRELVGTRYTWYSTGPASGDAESKELLGKLMMTDVNWMNECLQRAKRGKTPKLAQLCERKIDQFGIDDVLTSYAFAAYLIEGRADALGDFLGRVAAQGSAKALEAALGTELGPLDTRWTRWLAERK